MQSISPVLTEKEVEHEQVIALDQQPEYYPIVVARVTFQEENGMCSKATYTRFRSTDAERKAIAEGADLLLSQPHHGSLMPIGLQLAKPNEYPTEA